MCVFCLSWEGINWKDNWNYVRGGNSKSSSLAWIPKLQQNYYFLNLELEFCLASSPLQKTFFFGSSDAQCRRDDHKFPGREHPRSYPVSLCFTVVVLLGGERRAPKFVVVSAGFDRRLRSGRCLAVGAEKWPPRPKHGRSNLRQISERKNAILRREKATANREGTKTIHSQARTLKWGRVLTSFDLFLGFEKKKISIKWFPPAFAYVILLHLFV